MGIAIANPPDKPVEQYFAKRYSLYDDRLNIFLKNPEFYHSDKNRRKVELPVMARAIQLFLVVTI